MTETSKIMPRLDYLIILLTVSLAFTGNGCSDNNESAGAADGPLYTLIAPQTSGLTFTNELKESLLMNGLLYEYYYNGAGLAVEDFNGDGLMDVYFISNLESNKLYINEGDFTFRNVTTPSGLKGKYGFPGGVTTTDINGDGRVDIYICKSGKFEDPEKRRNELYINLGNNEYGVPVFRESARKYGLDLPHYSTQAAFFDFDLDDDLDMFIINHGIDVYGKDQTKILAGVKSDFRGERLYRNDDGKFTDVSGEMNIVNSMIGYGLGLSVADLNDDGYPDVYVANDFDEKDHLYLNNGGTSFTESSLSALNQISFYSMGTDIGDLNNDGLPDIMTVDMMAADNYSQKTSMSGMNPERFYDMLDWGLHHQYMYNGLQLNRGTATGASAPSFSNLAFMGGVSQTDWSWGPLICDMNNDGHQDLYVSNGIKRDFRNNDFQKYHREQQAIMAATTDRDSRKYVQDLLDKMPGREKKDFFFLNQGETMTFENVASTFVTKETKSNGAAYADLDNDGDLDFVINAMDDTTLVYRNNVRQRPHNSNYLTVNLRYRGGNILAYQSKVRVYAGDLTQYREVSVTRGFQSASPRELFFGLGSHERIDSVVVTWPNGEISRLTDVTVNQKVLIDYADGSPQPAAQPAAKERWFVAKANAFDWEHRENHFNDFARESLLPHRMSRFGPAMAVGDVDGDDLDDVFFGNAKGAVSGLFLQRADGSFSKSAQNVFRTASKADAVDALFVDLDNDNDLDLIVTRGGNEVDEGDPALMPSLYLNDGKGTFSKSNALPSEIAYSASSISTADIDGDDDLDLIIAGRQNPGNYPLPGRTTLLRNDLSGGSLAFADITDQLPYSDGRIGMVTEALFTDHDADGNPDLLLTGEWMSPTLLLNDGSGNFSDGNLLANPGIFAGWWNSLLVTDFDDDGTQDIIAGNLGSNYKYQASNKAPFEVYFNDFDQDQINDIVLAYYEDGEEYPLRGRECSSNQMDFIKEKFPDYHSYGSADLVDIYEKEKLDSSYSLRATDFHHYAFSGEDAVKLPALVQASAINDAVELKIGGEKYYFLAGNLYASEVETPRSDAGYGVLLKYEKGGFRVIPNHVHGIYLRGQVSTLSVVKLAGGKTGILAAMNDAAPVLYRFGSSNMAAAAM